MISATKKRRRSCAIESSTNRRCEYAWNRWDLSTSHRSITTKRWSRLLDAGLATRARRLQTKAQLNAVPVVTHLANIHAVAAPLCRGAGALEHGDRARGYTASDYL